MTMPDPKRGEIWQINLEPTRGDEIAKTRPVAVMNPDSIGRLALRIVVPITDWKGRYQAYPWMMHLEPNAANGLSKPSAADAFQVRSVSLQRFVAKIGSLSEQTTDAIAAAIALSVGFQP